MMRSVGLVLFGAVVVLVSLAASARAEAPPTPAGGKGNDGSSSQMSAEERRLERERLLGIAAAARAPVKDADLDVPLDDQPALGAADAEVIIVEFHDFQCGFCRRHAAQTLPQLMADYVQQGLVRILFFDYPAAAHPFAAKAAEAARCAADQNRYQALRSRFYDHAKALHPQFLPDHARAADLDVPTFEACLASGRHAAAIVADRRQGMALGVRGTPTFFVGVPSADGAAMHAQKRIDGAQPIAVFREVIEQVRAGVVTEP
jgi:protein-disulfide isomerase